MKTSVTEISSDNMDSSRLTFLNTLYLYCSFHIAGSFSYFFASIRSLTVKEISRLLEKKAYMVDKKIVLKVKFFYKR